MGAQDGGIHKGTVPKHDIHDNKQLNDGGQLNDAGQRDDCAQLACGAAGG